MDHESEKGGLGGSRKPFGLPGRLQRPTRRLRPSVSPGGAGWSARAIGRPGRLQRAIGIARETPETDLDSPRGSRRLFGQPRRQQKAVWTAREAPESHLRGN